MRILVTGKAEADAAGFYVEAHKADPAFYELRRTLEAYKTVLDEKTTIVLSADADLLKYLTQGPAALDGPTTKPTKPTGPEKKPPNDP